MKGAALAGLVIGEMAAALLFLNLRSSGHADYHRNPFALNQSGYGTMLARLGQTNLDRAWHYGAVAGELGKHHDGGEGQEGGDEHAGHNHGSGDGHPREVLRHDDGAIIGPAMDFLVDLDSERFRRTSWFPPSREYEEAVARDIEKMMLRAYNMDPTDFGAYDAYFHFMVYHKMRGTPEDRKKASQMSEYTIQTVFREKVDPMPWLTASAATLNQFFLHQGRYHQETEDENADLPAEVLKKYQDRMKFCLGNYVKLKKEATEAGRWNRVSEDRRKEAEERARLNLRMMAQFQLMIDKQEKGKKNEPSPS